MSILENTFVIESNLYDFFRTIAKLSKRSLYTDKYLSWVNCAPSPWPCGIFNTNFNSEDVNEKIQFVKDQIARGIVPNRWMTGPSMHPNNFDERLLKHGFTKKDEATGMALDFSKLKCDFEQTSGLDIQIVTDAKNLRDWAIVVASALLGCAENDASRFYELMATVLHCDKVLFFIGYYEDRPIASSTLFVPEDVVGIYHVATAPSFRNKGIGRSMTLAPLLQARESGARFAVLQATEPGKSLFASLGFAEYCKLSTYILPPTKKRMSERIKVE